jgi:hypothetical protein
MLARLSAMSYTSVDFGLMRHSPLSRHRPLSPNASPGGMIAWTFIPTLMFSTLVPARSDRWTQVRKTLRSVHQA